MALINFARLKEGLSKTRNRMAAGLDAVFGAAIEFDDDFYEELEEVLIMSDVGVTASGRVLDSLKQTVKSQRIKTTQDCRNALICAIAAQMRLDDNAYDFEDRQSVVLMIGVNGTGKTTSAGKLANIFNERGKKVIIAAADTYRAAAAEQLEVWSKRAGAPLIKGMEGTDPAAVIFDACRAAQSRKADILICDTAGRLHNKKNLMAELSKIDRVISRELPAACRESLIVLDATTGQNAIAQAREFGNSAKLSGIILTKMDGTAKGGVAVAIASELSVPVKYIGVGEQIHDLQRFDPEAFARAIVGEEIAYAHA